MSTRSHLLVALASLTALGSCATTSVAVAPGHAAVVLSPDGAANVLGEGVSEVPADSLVDDFDLREQQQGGTLLAITRDGVPIAVGDPIVSYRLIGDELAAADRTVGPRGWRALIAPIVHATIASVLAAYRWSDLDTPHMREAQEKITTLARARLRRYHVALSSVELKGLVPRLPGTAKMVTATSVWEQRSLAAKSRLEIARREADRLRAEAAGIAASYRSVAPTLSPGVLANQRDKAWQRLIASPRSTVLIANEPSPQLEVSP